MKRKFVLVGHPRCGSSVLTDILQTQVPILFEPFNRDRSKWYPEEKSYFNYVHDKNSMQRQLDEIFSKYDGFKLLCFDLPKQYVEQVVTDSDYLILFLRRRNLLQTLVSFHLAYETDIWHRRKSTEEIIEDRYSMIGSIPLYGLREGIRAHKEAMDYYESLLHNRVGWLKIYYEDLFGPNKNEVVQQINRLLGIDLSLETFNTVVTKNRKLNNIDSYKRIPNCHVINEQLGNDETGFLFEKERA